MSDVHGRSRPAEGRRMSSAPGRQAEGRQQSYGIAAAIDPEWLVQVADSGTDSQERYPRR